MFSVEPSALARSKGIITGTPGAGKPTATASKSMTPTARVEPAQAKGEGKTNRACQEADPQKQGTDKIDRSCPADKEWREAGSQKSQTVADHLPPDPFSCGMAPARFWFDPQSILLSSSRRRPFPGCLVVLICQNFL
jgi:hypothetical protein